MKKIFCLLLSAFFILAGVSVLANGKPPDAKPKIEKTDFVKTTSFEDACYYSQIDLTCENTVFMDQNGIFNTSMNFYKKRSDRFYSNSDYTKPINTTSGCLSTIPARSQCKKGNSFIQRE
jgi:hypothetical protein